MGGECNIPSLRTWAERLTFSRAARRYVPDTSLTRSAGGTRVLQLSCHESGDGISIICTSLAGEALCTVTLQEIDFITDVPGRIATEIAAPEQCLRLVLPNGNLLSSMPVSSRVNELRNMCS